MQTEILVDSRCRVGENPLWDERRQALFWCDILAGHIWRWDYASGEARIIYTGPPCGAFTLQTDGSLLLLREREAARLDVESGQVTVLAREIVAQTGRFNDCLATPNAGIFAGTIDPLDDWHGKEGALFHLHPHQASEEIFRGTACSNGLAFSPDLQTLYWSDTTSRTIYIYGFDYDASSDAVGEKRVWLHTPDAIPDGLTIDESGDVWIAFFGAGAVRCFDSNAKYRRELLFPASKITSCTFGGPDYDELFISSAGGSEFSADWEGAVFRVKMPVKGRAEFRTAWR